jgi:hypothetical protein
MQTPLTKLASPASAGACTASPRVRTLLDSLHATILEERLQAAPVPPGAVVLLAVQYTHHLYSDKGTHRRCYSFDDLGGELRLQSGYEVDLSCDSFRPWLWYGSENRVDALGEHWSRQLPKHVTNDFGDLVPVSA